MKKYVIVGCEHSGTRVFCQNVCNHPDVENDQVEHLSIPSGGKNFIVDHCDRMRDTSFDLSYIFVMRDKTCVSKSQEKGGSFDTLYRSHHSLPPHPMGHNHLYGRDVISNWTGCFDRLFDTCVENDINYTIVSYEGYIQSRRQILFKMYSDIGLDPKIVDYTKMTPGVDYKINETICYDSYMGQVTPKDGNAKYFT